MARLRTVRGRADAGDIADWDIELRAADGVTWLPFMLALETDRDGVRQPKRFDEALEASVAQAPLVEWLTAVSQEDWFPGLGISYDVALGCDTWSSPGYVLPGGAATDVVLPATGNSASPIVAIVEFANELFIAQQGSASVGGRVLYSIDRTGLGSGAFNNSLMLPPGEYIRDMVVAEVTEDLGGGTVTTGNYRLLVTSTDVNGSNGRLHKLDDGSLTWTSTALGTFGSYGRNRIVQIFWTDQDGIGSHRLVTVSSNRGHLAYTRPGSDPMQPASWIENVRTGSNQPGGDLVAARRHVWLSARDNLFDINELGESAALTSYSQPSQGNGLASAYLDGWVYRSYQQGVDRVRVDEGALLQSIPGICTPGWGTRTESGWTIGWGTALLPWDGGMLCAMYSVVESRPCIYWGKDRIDLGVETPNPLVWHGPFAVGTELATVTKMAVSYGSLPDEVRLWVATFITDQTHQPQLTSISLPPASGALANTRGAGTHRYATGAAGGPSSRWQNVCQLHLLPETLGDKASMKHLHQVSYGTLGLGDPTSATRIEVLTRADPPPYLPSGSAWPPAVPISTGPVATVQPAVASGHKIQHRVDLFSPAGGGSPPKPAILDSIRPEYWKIVPDVDSWTLTVEYGPGVVGLSNTDWVQRGLSVQAQTDALLALCRGGATVMRDRNDVRWHVKVKHARQGVTTFGEYPYGQRATARITVARLGVV